MSSSVSKYVIPAILLIGTFGLPRTVAAAIEYASFASLQDGVVRLQTITFNTSPNDRAVVFTIGVRGNRFSGPGYSELGPWNDQLLNADIVVAISERLKTAIGTHCVAGQHRWTTRTNVTFLRVSPQACAAKSGGGACSIVEPQTSILSLSGERASLPAASLKPLTRRGVAEDARPIVLDEFALLEPGSLESSFEQVSEEFQVTPSLVSTLMSRTHPATALVTPSIEMATPQPVDVLGIAPIGGRGLRGGSGAMLVIQHQREHPVNERFAPVPQIAFAPQVLAMSPEVQERRGFAIVDLGASGRVLHVEAISESAAPATSAIIAAISNGISSQFTDERRHDHRVYLAYEIDGQTLREAGKPFVTMPMCCSCDPDPHDEFEYQCP